MKEKAGVRGERGEAESGNWRLETGNLKAERLKHRTSNIELPTSNGGKGESRKLKAES